MINLRCELAVLAQFLDALPVELRVWLCERKPSSVAKASAMADDYRAAHRQKHFEGGKTDPKMDPPSKGTTDSRQHRSDKNIRKGRPQKKPTDPNYKREHGRDLAEWRCSNCHERGHRARDCPGALYCGVLQAHDSQGPGGRDVEGAGVVGEGSLGGSGGGSGVVVEGAEEGLVGDGGGAHGGDGSGGEGDVAGCGQAGVLWGHVEVRGTVGDGGGRRTTSNRTIDSKPVNATQGGGNTD